MKWIVTTSPVAWNSTGDDTDMPLAFDAVRDHLRIGSTQDYDHIVRLVRAATDYAEERLGAFLMPRTIEATYFGNDDLILPRVPLIEIDSIIDANGTSITNYDIVHEGTTIRIEPHQGVRRPLVITYQAGYPTRDHIPAGIRLGLLTHVGTLYEARESTSEKPRHAVPHSLDDFYRLKSRTVSVG